MFKFNRIATIDVQNDVVEDIGNHDSEQIEYIVHTVAIENELISKLSLLHITSNGHIKISNGIDEDHIQKTTYRHILTPVEAREIQSSQYVKKLTTFFIQLKSQIILLNTGNLTRYDKINEKHGYKTKLYSFSFANDSRTVLIYGCLPTNDNTKNKSVLLKCFFWDTASGEYMYFRSHELQLPNKNDVINDISILQSGHHDDKIVIITSTQVFVWDILSNTKSKKIEQITNYMAKKWYDMIDAVNSIEEEQKLLQNSNEKSSKTDDYKKPPALTNDDIFTGESINSNLTQNSNLSKSKYWFQSLNYTQKAIKKSIKYLKLVQLKGKLYMITSMGQTYQISHKNSKYYLILITQYKGLKTDLQLLKKLNNHLISYDDASLDKKTQNISILDPIYGYVYGELSTIDQPIIKIYPTKENKFILQHADFFDIYSLSIDDRMDRYSPTDSLMSYQQRMLFWESVLESGIYDVNAAQLMKLRDISCLWGLKVLKSVTAGGLQSSSIDSSLQKYCITKSFQKFLEFLAPPKLITPLIEFIPASLCRELVIPFFIEIERFCKNIYEGNLDKCVWKQNIQIDLNFFMLGDDDDNTTIQDLLKLVDTTLFSLYLNYNDSLLKPFLRVPNQCDVDFVIEKLAAKSKFQDLIDFFYSRNLHDRALKFMITLDKYVPNIPLDSIMKLVFNYICQLNNDNLAVICEYLEWLFNQEWSEKSPTDMFEILFFQKRIHFDALKVYEFIKVIDDSFSYKYLEYCVTVLQDKNTQIYMELIKHYLENISKDQDPNIEDEYLSKLYSMVQNKPFYDSFELLSLLNDKLNSNGKSLNDKQTFVLTHSKSLALKQMKDHEAGLKTIINEMHNYPVAIEYVKSIEISDGEEEFKSVLKILFDILCQQDNFKKLVLLINEFGSFFDPLYLLQHLPTDMSLQELQSFLIHNVLFATKRNLNKTQLQKSLAQVSIIDLDCKNLNEKSTSFSIEEKSQCFACGKLLSPGLIPNAVYYGYKIHGKDILVHHNCRHLIDERIKHRNKIKKLVTLGELNKGS